VEGADAAGVKVEVRFPLAGHLYEMRSRGYLGEGDRAEFRLEPASAPVFSVMPYEVEGLELSFEGGAARAGLKTSKPAGEHVFRFDLFDAGGQRLLDSGANVVASGGTAEWKPEDELPAGGRLVCRDVATGVSAEIELG